MDRPTKFSNHLKKSNGKIIQSKLKPDQKINPKTKVVLYYSSKPGLYIKLKKQLASKVKPYDGEKLEKFARIKVQGEDEQYTYYLIAIGKFPIITISFYIVLE